jgi:hypothetical protein
VNNALEWTVSMTIVGGLAFLGGFWVGQKDGNDEIRREAVKAGIARYVPDAEGRAKFEWIAPKEVKP